VIAGRLKFFLRQPAKEDSRCDEGEIVSGIEPDKNRRGQINLRADSVGRVRGAFHQAGKLVSNRETANQEGFFNGNSCQVSDKK
jgi:hypothetical protein